MYNKTKTYNNNLDNKETKTFNSFKKMNHSMFVNHAT